MKSAVSVRLINLAIGITLLLGVVLTVTEEGFAQDLDNVTMSGRLIDQKYRTGLRRDRREQAV